jgi:hypothetical protein
MYFDVPGVPIFSNFCQFSENFFFFSKHNFMSKFLQKLSVHNLNKKRKYFCQISRRKYLENHNIGSWLRQHFKLSGTSLEYVCLTYFFNRTTFSYATIWKHRPERRTFFPRSRTRKSLPSAISKVKFSNPLMKFRDGKPKGQSLHI